jgi:hypothetical protein
VVLAAAGTFFLLLSTACDLISPFCGGVTISLVLSISKFDFSEPSLGCFIVHQCAHLKVIRYLHTKPTSLVSISLSVPTNLIKTMNLYQISILFSSTRHH